MGMTKRTDAKNELSFDLEMRIDSLANNAKEQIKDDDQAFIKTLIQLGTVIQEAYKAEIPRSKVTYKQLSSGADFDFNYIGIPQGNIDLNIQEKLKVLNVAWIDAAVYEANRYFTHDKNKRLKSHFSDNDRSRLKLAIRFMMFTHGLADKKGRLNTKYNNLTLTQKEAEDHNKFVSEAIAHYYSLRQKIIRAATGFMSALGAFAYAISMSVTISMLLAAVWPATFVFAVGVALVGVLTPIFYRNYNSNIFRLFLNILGRNTFGKGIYEYYDPETGEKKVINGRRRVALGVAMASLMGFAIVYFFIMHSTLLSLTSISALGFLTASAVFPPLVVVLAAFYAVFMTVFTASIIFRAFRLKNITPRGLFSEIKKHLDDEFNSERAKERNKEKGYTGSYLRIKKIMTIALLILFGIGVVVLSIVTLFLAVPAVTKGLHNSSLIMKGLSKASGYVITMVLALLSKIGGFAETVIRFAKLIPSFLLKYPLGITATLGLLGLGAGLVFLGTGPIGVLSASVAAVIFLVAVVIKLVKKSFELSKQKQNLTEVELTDINPEKVVEQCQNDVKLVKNAFHTVALSIQKVMFKFASVLKAVLIEFKRVVKKLFSKPPSYQPSDGDRGKQLANLGRLQYLTTGEREMSKEVDGKIISDCENRHNLVKPIDTEVKEPSEDLPNFYKSVVQRRPPVQSETVDELNKVVDVKSSEVGTVA